MENQDFAAKSRHGCVTAWLILMIVVNAIAAASNLLAGDFLSESLGKPVPHGMMVVLSLIAVVNVVFAVMLMQWKKWAFWGFAISSVVTMGINVGIGFGIAQSLLGLVGFAILYIVLQIKERGRSSWENLE